MGDHISPALAELKTLITSTWTDLVTAGKWKLWEQEHVLTIDYETLLDFTLPYGVLAVRPSGVLVAQDTPDTFLDCEVYYVADIPGKPTTLRTKTQALRDALNSGSFTAFQVWPEPPPSVSYSAEMDINRILRTKKEGVLAGVVRFRLLCGD